MSGASINAVAACIRDSFAEGLDEGTSMDIARRIAALPDEAAAVSEDRVDTVWSLLVEAGDESLRYTAEKIVEALSQTLPAPGEVERNLEAQRQTIEACAGIADIHAEPTDTPDDFTKGYEIAAGKIARSIRKLCPNASLATVAAANDEGVARAIEAAAKICDERAAGRIRMYEDNQAGINAFKAVEAEECAAAIRLLSQGGGKA